MRTYLILKEKVARFNADAEIQALLGELARARREAGRARPKFSHDARASIKDAAFDLDAMRDAGLRVRAARSADDGDPARSALTWPSRCFLGLDVGTSGVKAILVARERRRRGVGDHAAHDVDAAARVGGAGSGGVVAGDASRRSRRCSRAQPRRDASRRSASRGRCTRRCFSTRTARSFGPRCSGATAARRPSAREITERVGGEERLRDLASQSGARGIHAARRCSGCATTSPRRSRGSRRCCCRRTSSAIASRARSRPSRRTRRRR